MTSEGRTMGNIKTLVSADKDKIIGVKALADTFLVFSSHLQNGCCRLSRYCGNRL